MAPDDSVNHPDSAQKNGNSLDAILIRIWRFRRHLIIADRYEQLGLLYVATYAKKSGYKVEVYDPPSLTFQKIHDKLTATYPRVVGFYCDHDNMTSVCRVSKLLKEKIPQLVIIAGGPQADAASAEVMREGCFDALVRGEGEIAFVELLDFYIKNFGTLEPILGITYWKGTELIHNPDRPPHSDLDNLPFPDRSLSEKNAEPRGYETILSGRGCPYRCAFCAEGSNLSKTYRYRSPQSVLEEVDYLLQERQLRYLMFMDDTFVANPSRAIQISRGLKERLSRGADFRWYCEARVDILCHLPEMLEIMKEGGLSRIQIGIESGRQHILDAYGKQISLEQIRRAVKLIVEAGIPSIIGNFIIGGAHETSSSIAETIEFAQELIEMAPGRIELSATYLTPYPGTSVSRRPQDYGVKIIDPKCLTGEDDRYCFVETNDLNKWEIIDAHERFVAACKNSMLQALKDKKIPDEVISEHFLLFDRYHIMTQWLQIYLPIHYIWNYYGLLLDDNYSRLADIPPDDLPNWHPVRTYAIGESHNGHLIIKPLDGIFEFDALGTAIYEHCSGRTSLSCLSQIIKSRFFPTEPSEHVYALLLTFLKELEQKRLLVWAMT
jgi:radical SAM superfamily enzyme YgiQ (UPF0313 family)